jgi:diacylglycerol kinase (ATP)
MANHGRAWAMSDKIVAWCSKYEQVELVKSEEPGHARVLAESAVEQGIELVIAAGGDGTVHEVVNGIVHGSKSGAHLGVIPIGSGNDFAWGAGLLNDPELAVHQIFNGQPRSLDLARIEDDKGRYVLANNSIGLGLDATVVIQSQTITRIHGFAMYTLAALRTIAFYFETPHLEVHFDDERVTQRTLLLAIGIGPRAGGGFFLTPDAINTDNMLDSCTVNPVSRLTMFWMLPKVMRGTHVSSKHVVMRRSEYIDVRSNRPLPIHVDGEIFAYPDNNIRRVTVTSLPAALSVVGTVT